MTNDILRQRYWARNLIGMIVAYKNKTMTHVICVNSCRV